MFPSTWMIILNDQLNPINNFKIIICILILMRILSKLLNSKPSRNVYLVDFACYKPKTSQQITREDTINRTIKYFHQTCFTYETIQILRKMTMASGLGDATYVPETLMKDPPDFSLAGARQDAEAAICGAVDTLLEVTKVKVDDIGVLVVNSSVFNPIPSLAAMIVNRYKLRDDVKSYCLSGMGCSASLISINLARQLLQIHPNTYAMIVSTDVLGQNYYKGNEPQKLTINCVMRVGGAAILLTNKPQAHYMSKYQLVHSLRTNTSSLDNSYGCIFHEEDTQGQVGVSVTKDLLVATTTTFKAHLLALGSQILPIYERLMFMICSLCKLKTYTPNFGQAVDHFIPHVGVKSVLEMMEKTLMVNVEAARMTMYRFGNASSCSIWYELAYLEAKGKVKRGHKVWQMSFGSGFKCNSLICLALKDIKSQEEHNPWSQEIDNFPI